MSKVSRYFFALPAYFAILHDLIGTRLALAWNLRDWDKHEQAIQLIYG